MRSGAVDDGGRMKITLEWLQSRKACEEAVKQFVAANLDGGIELDELIRRIDRPDWLIWLLHHSGRCDLLQIVRIACLCARAALRFVPVDEPRPLAAIMAAEDYVRQPSVKTAAATWAAAEAVGAAVLAAAWAAGSAVLAAGAAARAAGAAARAAGAAWAAARAARAARAAAGATAAAEAAEAALAAAEAAEAAGSARAAEHERLCDLIRKELKEVSPARVGKTD